MNQNMFIKIVLIIMISFLQSHTLLRFSNRA